MVPEGTAGESGAGGWRAGHQGLCQMRQTISRDQISDGGSEDGVWRQTVLPGAGMSKSL